MRINKLKQVGYGYLILLSLILASNSFAKAEVHPDVSSEPIDKLFSKITSNSPHLKRQSASALLDKVPYQMGELTYVYEQLESKDEWTRALAVVIIGLHGESSINESFEQLTKLHKTDPSETVRHFSLWAVAQSPSKKPTKFLIAALDTKDEVERRFIVRTLAKNLYKLGGEKETVLEVLNNLQNDPDPMIRHFVGHQLKRR